LTSTLVPLLNLGFGVLPLPSNTIDSSCIVII
jgi:hypothetical protein